MWAGWLLLTAMVVVMLTSRVQEVSSKNLETTWIYTDTVSTDSPWDIPEEGEGDHRNNVVISIEAAHS